MPRLSWSQQIVLPWALWSAVAAGLWAGQWADQAVLQARLADVSALREGLDRHLSLIADKHGRAVQRARDVLLQPHPARDAVTLAWNARQYPHDMARAVAEAEHALQLLAQGEGDGSRAADLERVSLQLQRLLEDVAPLTRALAQLHQAVLVDQPEALRLAAQELERRERAVVNRLRVAAGMGQILVARQGQPPTGLAASWRTGALGLLLLGLAACIALSTRPARRLRRLMTGVVLRPEGAEEEALTALQLSHAAELGRALALLQERTREAERAQQLGRRTEHELALLRFYNENLVNSLRSAIVVTDAGGHITSFNRMARQQLGLETAALGQPIARLPLYAALARRCPELAAEIASALRQGEVRRYDAVPYGASPLLLDLTLAPYRDESGAARGLLWVADDVSEAVRTKHQLLRAERLAAVGRLSAQVAHEIRNPLSAIGLNAELLEEDFVAHLPPAWRDEARQLLRAIGREVERLTEVTETYLQLARQPQSQPRAADINRLLADMFVMLGEEMRAHAIEVDLELGTPAPTAQVDPGQLRQALLNIIRNGREAMPAGGVMRIATWTEADRCGIAISDTGSGIAQAVLPRVFEPFYSTKPAGTGLGLPLTQQIITEHGGSLDIQSRTGGTRVTVLLPQSSTG